MNMNLYVFIVNPVSGNGKALAAWEKVHRVLQHEGIPYKVYFTEYAGHAREIARHTELYLPERHIEQPETDSGNSGRTENTATGPEKTEPRLDEPVAFPGSALPAAERSLANSAHLEFGTEYSTANERQTVSRTEQKEDLAADHLADRGNGQNCIVPHIVSVGGDGTFHEIVNGLRDHPHITVSCIPAGSGNDACRGFGIPSSPLKALRHILQSETKQAIPYDLGEYAVHTNSKHNDVDEYVVQTDSKHNGLFTNGVGIGFDGEVARLTNTSGYKKWLNRWKLGGLAYAISALRLMFGFERNTVTLRIDGSEYTYEKVWLIAVTNIAYYGGGMKINPQADPRDGRLNVCIVHNISPLSLLFIFGTVFGGWHPRFKKAVKLLDGRQIDVQTDTKQMTVHADGEIIGTTPVSVSIQASARRIH
jgi:diacylglycerol kinase (ATP)